MSDADEKLALIRAALKQSRIDAYVIPLSDPHLGENIPDHWKIIPWLTGFTGSAATVVVTHSFAGLWTDSRYFLQAGTELENSGFTLVRPGSQAPWDYSDWLADNINHNGRVGFDGRIISVKDYRKLKKRLSIKNIDILTDCDLLSGIWKERPPMPLSQVWDFPAGFAGKERSLKITALREEMKKRGIGRHLLTSVDDIMWLLNIRGNDFPYSPLCISYALAEETRFYFFTDKRKIPSNLASEFDRVGVEVLPYEEVYAIISSLSDGKSILINPSATSVSLYNYIPAGISIVEDISIPSVMKSVKNKTEIENIGKVMVKDGVALTKFFWWLEQNSCAMPLTELSLSLMLEKFRSQQEEYIGPSFSPIVACNEHAALPHYSAAYGGDSAIPENSIVLVDSGGHYMGGTTDITRTISTGNPSYKQKKDFTLVLKGHIALAKAKFPHGTRGCQIDMLARQALWDNGYNYGHGTGHGVGYCLNVHEGPQSISPAENRTLLEAGMLISNEPALYREGEYGIRTENLVLCYLDEETEFGEFLKFDTVSLCYIDKSLIDRSLLTKDEINWINNYHSEVFEKLSPFLDEEEKKWLKEKTEAI
jgi:Xaa-Pro aminopeptidase